MHHFVYRLIVGQTKDGRWLQFAQNRPHLFEAFMRALGLEWMLTDPKWKGIPMLEDEQHRVELLERMLAGVRDRTLAEWQEVFEADRERVRRNCSAAGPTCWSTRSSVRRSGRGDDDPERARSASPARSSA